MTGFGDVINGASFHPFGEPFLALSTGSRHVGAPTGNGVCCDVASSDDEDQNERIKRGRNDVKKMDDSAHVAAPSFRIDICSISSYETISAHDAEEKNPVEATSDSTTAEPTKVVDCENVTAAASGEQLTEFDSGNCESTQVITTHSTDSNHIVKLQSGLLLTLSKLPSGQFLLSEGQRPLLEVSSDDLKVVLRAAEELL
jgi:hypothetical protein